MHKHIDTSKRQHKRSPMTTQRQHNHQKAHHYNESILTREGGEWRATTQSKKRNIGGVRVAESVVILVACNTHWWDLWKQTCAKSDFVKVAVCHSKGHHWYVKWDWQHSEFMRQEPERLQMIFSVWSNYWYKYLFQVVEPISSVNFSQQICLLIFQPKRPVTRPKTIKPFSFVLVSIPPNTSPKTWKSPLNDLHKKLWIRVSVSVAM